MAQLTFKYKISINKISQLKDKQAELQGFQCSVTTAGYVSC